MRQNPFQHNFFFFFSRAQRGSAAVRRLDGPADSKGVPFVASRQRTSEPFRQCALQLNRPVAQKFNTIHGIK